MSRETIRVGVSACLLGQEVRHDGGHKHRRYLTGVLAEHFVLVPVCPEVEVGMGTPRETVRLEGDPAAPRMIAPRSGTDWTSRMNAWSRRRLREDDLLDLDGFVFKKKSPSCGLYRLGVVQEAGRAILTGRGLFAAAFTTVHPLVPVEEEGRLDDPRLRENFLERVFAYHRLKSVFAGRWRRGTIVDFHSREKYRMLAHSPRHYKELGRLVARIAEYRPSDFRTRYMELYMAGLGVKATTRRHVNALLHIAGHMRKPVPDPAYKRVLAVIEDYGAGLVPLVVPMTLLKHYIELHEIPYVSDQVYLNPHPKELMLRNHV
jgi:uncharacterized protein YbgA (DUF1722 family)/uncharacterized protein YbbK (DUF523 family)